MVYYKLDPIWLDTCLNCHLPECIWEQDDPQLVYCPVERISLANSPLWQAKKKQLAQIVASHPQGISPRELSRRSGISSQLLSKWMRRTQAFVYNATPVVPGSRVMRYIITHLNIQEAD